MGKGFDDLMNHILSKSWAFCSFFFWRISIAFFFFSLFIFGGFILGCF